MQTADIVILAVLLLPALAGVIYGFLNIAFSITAWLLAFLVALRFSSSFTPLLEGYVDAPLIRSVLAFAGLFLLSLMVLSILGYCIVKLLGRTGLTAADRLFGFFLGLGLGGFILVVMVFLAGFTSLPKQPWWQQAVLIQPFERVAVWGSRMLPENVAKYHGYEST